MCAKMSIKSYALGAHKPLVPRDGAWRLHICRVIYKSGGGFPPGIFSGSSGSDLAEYIKI